MSAKVIIKFKDVGDGQQQIKSMFKKNIFSSKTEINSAAWMHQEINKILISNIDKAKAENN